MARRVPLSNSPEAPVAVDTKKESSMTLSTNLTTPAITKYHLQDAVFMSTLSAGDKLTLLYLIKCWNEQSGQLNPGVAKLAAARCMKNAKNFKGADKYLPGLVTVKKNQGFGNHYVLNTTAILALPQMDVNTEKYRSANPPSVEGYPADADTSTTPLLQQGTPPSTAGYYPPSVEGYSPLLQQGLKVKEKKLLNTNINIEGTVVQSSRESSQDLPLVELSSGFAGMDVDLEISSSGELDLGFADLSFTSGEIECGSAAMEESFTDILPLIEAIGAEAPQSPLSPVLADVVTADAAPTDSVLVESIPGVSDIHEYNEEVTYLTDVNEATDALLRASESVDVPEVQKIPEKPQKPVFVAPSRNPYHSDEEHQRKLNTADTTYLKAMGKWRQDTFLWESKYGDNLPEEKIEAPKSLSPEGQARLDSYVVSRY